MDLRDGYIVGIYNYCDRWCERCPLTSRCRVFADNVELEASDDPLFVTLGARLWRSAGALDASLGATPLSAIEADDEEFEGVGDLSIEGGTGEAGPAADALPPEHEVLRARSMQYGQRVFRWFEAHLRVGSPAAGPYDVIAWFQFMLAAKIDRALHGLRDASDGQGEYLRDAEGSAKVALMGAERSLAAWRALVESGVATDSEVEPFLDDLAWVIAQLDRLIPTARDFVRPGFDEPDAVAGLVVAGD